MSRMIFPQMCEAGAGIIVNIAGIAEFETADGTKVRMVPGDILVAEDLTGHGHIARSIGDEPRISLAIPMPD